MSVTIASVRRFISDSLTPAVGSDEARAMTTVVLEDVLGIKAVDIAVNPGRQLSEHSVQRVNAIVDRVVAGEPLQYVIGSALFHGIRLAVRPGVLIPRPETSQLVDIIVDRVGSTPDLRVLDVCCGSGAIAAALGRTLIFPVLTAVDLSDEAISVASDNFSSLKLKVTIDKRDVLTHGLPPGPFEVVVSNPPYVDESEKVNIDSRVLDHEPAMALFVPDNDPLVFYRHIAIDALRVLVAGGLLFFEINPRHSESLAQLLNDLGYDNVEILRDYRGRYRFAVCKKNVL